MRLKQITRHIPLMAVLGILATMLPEVAMANTTAAPVGGGINFGTVSDSVNSVIGLLSGPIARLSVIVCILGAAFMLMQGKEMGEGIKVLAIVALAMGLILGAVGFMGGVGADVATPLTLVSY